MRGPGTTITRPYGARAVGQRVCAPGAEPEQEPSRSRSRSRAGSPASRLQRTAPGEARASARGVRVVTPPSLRWTPPWSTSSVRRPLRTGNVQSFLSSLRWRLGAPSGPPLRSLPLIHPARLLPPSHSAPAPSQEPPVRVGQTDSLTSRPARTPLSAGSCRRPHPRPLSPSRGVPSSVLVSCATPEDLRVPLHCCLSQTLLRGPTTGRPEGGQRRQGARSGSRCGLSSPGLSQRERAVQGPH